MYLRIFTYERIYLLLKMKISNIKFISLIIIIFLSSIANSNSKDEDSSCLITTI